MSLFGTIQLLFATSCHHSRLTTRIRSCILDMDDLSHTIRDYSGVFVKHSLGDYISVLEPKNHALDIRRKLFGENHSETADSYLSVGVTQHSVGDYNSALESKTGALEIRRKTVW